MNSSLTIEVTPRNDDLRLVCHAPSLAGTDVLGTALATALTPASVIVLLGELGSGKTRLVEAIACGLGCPPEVVTSPTFVLIQEYDGRLPLYHFDAWRLRDSDEFLELGADELLAGDGCCCVEWGDRVADVLPSDRLTVSITPAGPESRRFTCTAAGPRSRRILLQTAATLQPDQHPPSSAAKDS